MDEGENTFVDSDGAEEELTESEALSPKHEADEDKIDFYVGLNKKVLPAKYKGWIGTNMREEYFVKAEQTKLKEAINELYRSTSFIGDGGTADVIRFEYETGLKLGRKNDHTQKGQDMIRFLTNKVLTQDLSTEDRQMTEKLIEALQDALGGKVK